MSESASATALVGQFLDLATGKLTRGAQYLLQQWQTQLAAGFDSNGNLISNLEPSVSIVGRSGTIGGILAQITAQGIVQPAGMAAATSHAQGAVVLPAGATSNVLGSASGAAAGSFDPAGAAATAQTNAENYAANAANTAQTNAENFASNASNINSGTLSTTRLPGITVTITTAKLTTGGANGSQTFTNGLLTAQVQAT